MFISFFIVTAEWAPDWTFPTSPLHINTGQDPIMSQHPDKEIHLKKSFHVRNTIPNSRVDRGSMANQHVITSCGGV